MASAACPKSAPRTRATSSPTHRRVVTSKNTKLVSTRSLFCMTKRTARTTAATANSTRTISRRSGPSADSSKGTSLPSGLYATPGTYRQERRGTTTPDAGGFPGD
jgi:hypothetical protein